MSETPRPPTWLKYMTWVPILLYFLLKYVVIGREQITTRQSLLLLGSVVLAEVALWSYRLKFARAKKEEDGTDT